MICEILCSQTKFYRLLERFLSSFLFEMGESKHFFLAVLAASRALACLEKEMMWILCEGRELAYTDMMLFFIQCASF